MIYSALKGINADDSNMSQVELNTLYNNLNMYLNQYFNKYISHIVENLDNLLAQYEYKPYESVTNKKDNDLDFLAAVFGDSNMVREVIEYDLQKQITEEEFTSLYGNVDYMIKLFEEYITIAGDKKFKFDDYDITKDDLQQLLNKIIQDYHKNEMLNESIELDENQNLEIHK